MCETKREEPVNAVPDESEQRESDAEAISPLLARLIEEVRNEKIDDPNAYNRMHNRHNRSR